MPRLTQTAYNFQCIIAINSDCERLFSSAKLTITSERQRLETDNTEAIELMNVWLSRGLIQMSANDSNAQVAITYKKVRFLNTFMTSR